MTAVASTSMPSIPTSDFPRERSRSPVKSTPDSPELRRKTSSASISDLAGGIPRPPSAADLRPNAHPYPIATTATGVLSRANSLSSPAGNSGKHHYVPPSPAKEQHEGKDGGSGGKGRDERRRAEYRGHRYSRSLSNSEDMHLPSSPAGTNPGTGEYTGNGPRALPIPPNVNPNSIAAMNAAVTGSYSAYAAATSGISPKRSGSASPTRGRTGPRVSAVYEVEEPEDIDSEDEKDGTPSGSHRRRMMSVPIASPFPTSAPRQSPFAAQFEANVRPSPSPSPSPTSGRFRNGRVKGMVRSFESSGSESGSPERERSSGSGFRESGSGFRAGRINAGGNGSGFRNGGGSGFRPRSQSQSEEEDVMGGTVRPQGTGGGRALPVRPDGVDLGGATVRGYDHATYVPPTAQHANGVLGTFAANGGAKDDEELTVEELIAREDAAMAAQGGMGMGPGPGMMSPSHTGGGVWRKGSKRGMVGAGMSPNHTGMSPNHTGMSPNHTGMSPNHTGGADAGGARHPAGGRPLPPHPTQVHTQRMSSGGVHAWEADDGAVGSTMKWVPQPEASRDVGRVFQVGEQLEAKKDSGIEVEAIPEPSAEEHERERAARRAKELAQEQAQKRAQSAKLEKEAEERGRARGAAVRARLEEAANLRVLVDAFRVRLEEVERKVGEMEAAFDNAGGSSQSPASAPAPTSPSTTTITQRLDPRRLLALFAQAPRSGVTREAANKSQREGRDDWVGPTTLGALPSYVLLVGLGMCAVVLKVLVRRGLGLGAGAVRRGA
ncbi:hypothetical protein MSAN_00454600 [Mycena sanguinolenta]|uniref:Uncharacterized protein n=1 Tax=Mycena sanguinolenta TaxID=230812 RepID=A0A8H7DIL2_9AGAR|nr:hypothetical protein MSAN_00454600 [Mycena sanguinolenta]